VRLNLPFVLNQRLQTRLMAWVGGSSSDDTTGYCVFSLIGGPVCYYNNMSVIACSSTQPALITTLFNI